MFFAQKATSNGRGQSQKRDFKTLVLFFPYGREHTSVLYIVSCSLTPEGHASCLTDSVRG